MSSYWDRIGIPQNAPARKLLADLEARLIGFLDDLPVEQNMLARRKATIQGDPQEPGYWKLTDIHPTLVGVPWLFWEHFAPLPPQVIQDIAFSGACLGMAAMIKDHLIDRQIPESMLAEDLQHRLEQQASIIYQNLFKRNSPFWDLYAKWMGANTLAWQLEGQAQEAPELFDGELLDTLSLGKAAPVAITIHAMSTFKEDHGIGDQLENSVVQAVKASILGDDLQDWRTDLAEGHLTGFLVELKNSAESQDKNIPEIEWLEKNLERTSLDITHYRLMIACLDTALKETQNIPCKAWQNLLNYHRELAEENMKIIFGQRFLKGF